MKYSDLQIYSVVAGECIAPDNLFRFINSLFRRSDMAAFSFFSVASQLFIRVLP